MDPSLRLVAVVLGLAVLIGGCLGPVPGDEDPPASLSSVAVYEYRYPGDDVHHPDHPYGWMARLTNVAAQGVLISVESQPADAVSWGPVRVEGWAQTGGEPVSLAPGESVLYLFEWRGSASLQAAGYEVRVLDGSDPALGAPGVLELGNISRALSQPATHAPVQADDHVFTATVGVWANGTSFYTNIAALNGDPVFPAGYDREGFGGELLPVYVYDAEGAERPPGSRDTCHFVTIAGYNALLKTQAEKTTGVRFLQPEEAYTRPGAESHPLYGDALVFMNTIVSHEGAVGPVGALPDPTGECFDEQNTLDWLPLP